eukprot:NODE_17195_length_217_cov_0.876543.p3 GENE.NODE_17195_length_217_cov_0.876543~~NODE_17195_length_217_cov_0.876543.p3  ORF type:complete len:57 (-),score=7.06 NODE_17195_length_217_cov_0.876543:12-182(-)
MSLMRWCPMPRIVPQYVGMTFSINSARAPRMSDEPDAVVPHAPHRAAIRRHDIQHQ